MENKIDSSRKIRQGVVISDKGDKSLVVRVERRAPHALYSKMVRLVKKYYVHDEKNEARLGDTVRIEECRPISKTKRWRLLEIVERATLNASEQQ